MDLDNDDDDEDDLDLSGDDDSDDAGGGTLRSSASTLRGVASLAASSERVTRNGSGGAKSRNNNVGQEKSMTAAEKNTITLLLDPTSRVSSTSAETSICSETISKAKIAMDCSIMRFAALTSCTKI